MLRKESIQIEYLDVLDYPERTRPFSTQDIFSWWEQRRLSYNKWIGGFAIFFFATSVGPFFYSAVWSVEQVSFLLFYFALYGILANLLFTSGSCFECLLFGLFSRDLSNRKLASNLFQIGSFLSIALTIILGLIVTLMAFARLTI